MFWGAVFAGVREFWPRVILGNIQLVCGMGMLRGPGPLVCFSVSFVVFDF